jgi:hypothetical protein
MAAVQVLKPRHVLELGAGMSTRAFMRAAAGQTPRCAISSVDHDPQYGALARAAAEVERPADVRVQFQIAPVVLREFGGEMLPAYSIRADALASRRPADLVLIDGPPEPLGGRQGTLYQLMSFVRPGTLVLADDAGRPHERGALEHWRDNLGDAVEIFFLPGFQKGMAAIFVRKPVPPADLWEHRARLTARDLQGLIPAGVPVVLADEGQWGAAMLPGRDVHPFVERDGVSYGPPENDEHGLRCLNEWRAKGVRYLAFAWPSFWWLDTYPRLARQVLESFPTLLRNSRLLVLDLAAEGKGARPDL